MYPNGYNPKITRGAVDKIKEKKIEVIRRAYSCIKKYIGFH